MLLLSKDFLLALGALLVGEEYRFALILLVKGLRLYGSIVNLALPALRLLGELFVGTLVGGYILEYILHIYQCELLRIRAHCRNYGKQGCQ